MSVLFERGEAGVCGGVQLVALTLGVGADAADFLGGLALGAVGALDGGGLDLLGACGLLLGPADLAHRLGNLAGCLVAGLADFVSVNGDILMCLGGACPCLIAGHIDYYLLASIYISHAERDDAGSSGGPGGTQDLRVGVKR